MPGSRVSRGCMTRPGCCGHDSGKRSAKPSHLIPPIPNRVGPPGPAPTLLKLKCAVAARGEGVFVASRGTAVPRQRGPRVS